MKILVLLGAALTMIMSLGYIEREQMDRFEFPVLMLFATLGMLMMVSANDLISLYLGLELQSLSLYVIAAFRRDTVRSSEAGAEILRSRRAVVRHAALRLLDGLRLHRHDQFRG